MRGGVDKYRYFLQSRKRFIGVPRFIRENGRKRLQITGERSKTTVHR